jgi:transcriptional regulator with XRE-family HTH domain
MIYKLVRLGTVADMGNRDFKALDDKFAAAFKLARVDADLSQEAVADQMRALGFDMSQPVIGKIERAKRRVTIGEAQALASCVKVPVSTLLAGPESMRIDRALSELYRLRREFFTAAENFQGGQGALAILADGIDRAGELDEYDRARVEHDLLETLEDVLNELKRDNIAESKSRAIREDLDWEDQDPEVVNARIQSKLDSAGTSFAPESFIGRYYAKFGHEVSHLVEGAGFEAIFDAGSPASDTEDADD